MSKRPKLKSYLVTVRAVETCKDGRERTHTDYRTFQYSLDLRPEDCGGLAQDLKNRIGKPGYWDYSGADRRGVFIAHELSEPTITVQQIRKPRAKKPRLMSRIAPNDSDYERRAVEYAKWLMARDEIKIPDGDTKCVWATVHSATKKNHNTGQATYEKRIRVVQFGYYADRWRKEGFTVESEFELPNFDFNPAAPIEEIGNWDAIEAHGLAHEKKIAVSRKVREARQDRNKKRGLTAAVQRMTPDLQFSDHGFAVSCRPVSDRGRDWFYETFSDDEERTFSGDSIMIEHRYLEDIVTGARGAGLVCHG